MANSKNVMAQVILAWDTIIQGRSKHHPRLQHLPHPHPYIHLPLPFHILTIILPSTQSTSGSTASTLAQRWEFAREWKKTIFFLKVKFWLCCKLDTCLYVFWLSKSIIVLTDCVMDMSLWIFFYRNMNKWCWLRKIIQPSGWSDRLLSGDDHPTNGHSFHFLLNLLTK